MRLSRVALRNDERGELDDVVVTDVQMFRAEFMDDDELWMRCYLANGETIDWWVTGKGLRMVTTDPPPSGTFEDFDGAPAGPPEGPSPEKGLT